MADLCDTCWYNNYDENDDMYYCDLQLDQDEYGKMIERERQGKSCKYYRRDIGEYGIVRKQN
ncbi:DUF6472 family protein [Eubacterium sp.]|uniref:DUF6472 family protein n=1 Tax=Eubacterium sp. TaxID=142586 RepID=UPI003991ABAB